jgi:hypothetical protein
MIPALLGLRHAIDRALEALAPLEPVIAVWQEAQENGLQEPAQASDRPARCLLMSPTRPTRLQGRARRRLSPPRARRTAVPIPSSPPASIVRCYSIQAAGQAPGEGTAAPAAGRRLPRLGPGPESRRPSPTRSRCPARSNVRSR